MVGVEILAMEEVVASCVFNWSVFWITFGIIFGIFVSIGVVASVAYYDWGEFALFLIVGALFGALLGVVFGVGESIPTEYETQYKVIISDEVSMNEFTEKYEIIEQDGKIYTVAERE